MMEYPIWGNDYLQKQSTFDKRVRRIRAAGS